MARGIKPPNRDANGYLLEVIAAVEGRDSGQYSYEEALAKVGMALMDSWYYATGETSMPSDTFAEIEALAEIRYMEYRDYLIEIGAIG